MALVWVLIPGHTHAFPAGLDVHLRGSVRTSGARRFTAPELVALRQEIERESDLGGCRFRRNLVPSSIRNMFRVTPCANAKTTVTGRSKLFKFGVQTLNALKG